MMKLYHSPASPYVRKVMVTAIETGLDARIELINAQVSPVRRDPNVAAHNPLGKIPTLETEAGQILFDSRVICAYLDRNHAGPRLIPEADPARSRTMTLEALADGLLDAALLARYERLLRPAERQWDDWIAGQMEKIAAALDYLADHCIDDLNGPVTMGGVAAACALGYLDFRFADFDWKSDRPRLAAWHGEFSTRQSMTRTLPTG